MDQKIIRTICYFSPSPSEQTVEKLHELRKKADTYGFQVQTIRICAPLNSFAELAKFRDQDILVSLGTVAFSFMRDNLDEFLNSAPGINANIELADQQITMSHVDLLFRIYNESPAKSFDFTYVFNNKNNSPYMPSANYEHKGFSIGLQPTNLSKGLATIPVWLSKLGEVWNEVDNIFANYTDYLGIDGSIAPLGSKEGSLVNFIERISLDYNNSFITPLYRQITDYLHKNNPRPIGLNGLMMPTLEDFDLATKYEQGEFSLERNIYVSLHSGLGIDTYPIAIDEDKTKVLNVLRLMQSLSNKYSKPLSVRFVSDGKTKIGEKSDFQNQYLKDVMIRSL